MSPIYLSPVANHLWQSSLFAGIAGSLTLTLRNHRARVRHWVWLAASWKFLIPFSVLISLGGQVHCRTAPHTTQSVLSVVMDGVSQPFTPPAASSAVPAAAMPAASLIPAIVWSVWGCGFLGIGCSWWIRWRRIRAAVRTGAPVHLETPIRAVSSQTLLEPGVFGVWRPVLLLPEGVLGRLTPAQLRGIIAHELCHVRHRDNLVAAIHMFVETFFWFDPLVWWIGKRMAEERELACDQEVLSLGSEPRIYAEGILNVCKFYLKSPLPCIAGVTGADLGKRIESIMKNRVAPGLGFTRKAILAVAAGMTVAVPIAIGMLHAPYLRAQSNAAQKRLTFDAASVKSAAPPPGMNVVGGAISAPRGIDLSPYRNTGGPGTGDPGRIHYPLISLSALLRRAYGEYFEIKRPAWADTNLIAVDAIMPSTTTKEQFEEMLQNLLLDRFALQTHVETKELNGYALTVARDGPKFKQSQPDSEPQGPNLHQIGADGFPVPPAHMRGIGIQGMPNERARLIGPQATMADLVKQLGSLLDSIVEDRTGLNGAYRIGVTYAGHLGGPHGATNRNSRSMAQGKFTPLELRIMQALWDRGPICIRDIQESFPESQRPAYTTVQTTIFRLEGKQAVRRVRKIGNAHIFEAVVSRRAAQSRSIDDLLGLFGGRTQPVITHLIESGKLTLDDVEEARKTLRNLAKKG